MRELTQNFVGADLQGSGQSWRWKRKFRVRRCLAAL